MVLNVYIKYKYVKSIIYIKITTNTR